MRRGGIGALLAGCALGFGSWAQAAFLRDLPITLTQPDGRQVACFMTGDEYFRWAHDAAGYVILQEPLDGRYVYAETSAEAWRPGPHAVGEVDPSSIGLVARPAVPARYHRERRELMAGLRPQLGPARANYSGTLQNIVIFLRFSGESEFTDPVSQYDGLFNAQGESANSMSHYYQEVSQSVIDIRTTFYPASTGTVVSHQSDHPRGYYQLRSPTNPGGYSPDNQGMEGFQRLHTLLQDAVTAVAEQVPAGLVVDNNTDGYVDNVCFIVKGSADNWADVLWPHMWYLMDGYDCSIHGVPVSTYDLQLQDVVNHPSVGNGVLCHEMFHSLGAPDLYRYETGSGSFYPVWEWDLMEANTNPPQHMLMDMKYEYGKWISAPPEITQSGVYTLNPVTAASNRWYKIASPHSTTEFFLVEYRRPNSSIFEAGIPGAGLIIYRVNTDASFENGNAFGPPDRILVFRPGGDNDTNGTPDYAHFSADVGRTQINDSSDPAAILANGSAGGLDIRNIGSAGETISFEVWINGQPPAGCTVPGDANGDAAVNVADAVAVVAHILETHLLGSSGQACADLNEDSAINVFDVVKIIWTILHPGPGLAPDTAGRDLASREPLLVRCEPTPEGTRLHLDGRRVHGLEWWIDATGVPAEARHGLRYHLLGDPLAEGELTLDLPVRMSGGDLVPGAGVRLLLADEFGEPLPFTWEAAALGRPAGLKLVAVRPSPAHGVVRFVLENETGRPGYLRVTDVSGRLVREWVTESAVRQEITWDGRDAAGRATPTGVYFALVPGSEGHRLLMLR